MDLLNLLKNAEITKVVAASSVATTALAAGTVLDMANYNSILFVTSGFWTSGAGHLMKAQKCATTTGGTAVDLSGASVTNLNSLGVMKLNITKPRDRYIRPVLIKAAVASAVNDVWAIRYNGRKRGDNRNTTSDADSGSESLSVISPTS